MKMAIGPATLVEDTEIGPQMASDVMNLKPQEIFKLVEEELVGKMKEQVNVIKKCIGNICREQALAHRHAAEAVDNMANLMELVSLPILIQRYDEANRGHKNTRSRQNDGEGTTESGCDQTGKTESR